jgi:hypothetical protein
MSGVVEVNCPHNFDEREIAVTADGYCPLCMAAEIKRLRHDLRHYDALQAAFNKHVEQQDAKIARLMAVLQEIAAYPHSEEGGEIARRFLEEDKT